MTDKSIKELAPQRKVCPVEKLLEQVGDGRFTTA